MTPRQPRQPLLAFVVYADPVPQGSKVRAGRGLRESNDRALRPWRAEVAAAALDAIARGEELPLTLGPVALGVTFTLRRPASHYGTGRNARQLKPTAPWFVATRPDTDKLVRAVCDALTGVAWRDDGQVAALHASKVYGPRAACHVELLSLPHLAAHVEEAAQL